MRKYRSPVLPLASSGKKLAQIATRDRRSLLHAREQLAARFDEQQTEQRKSSHKLYNL